MVNPVTKSNPNPVFVIGYMHSGTTLLLNILSQHSALIGSKGETKYYEFQGMLKQVYPDLEENDTLEQLVQFTIHAILAGTRIGSIKPPPSLQDLGITITESSEIFRLAQKNRKHGAMLPLVFNYLAKKSGKSHWLEKTPTHIFNIDKILRYVPNARFIEIVRDPRSILASKKVRRADVWSERYHEHTRVSKKLEKAYDPLWDTLSWRSAIQAGRTATQGYPNIIRTIRYEDLVTDQEKIIKEVCEFLDLTFEPPMLEIQTTNTAYWKEKNFQGISAQFIHRWKRELSDPEINIAQSLTRRQMEEFNYTRKKTSFRSIFILPLYLGKSSVEFFHRLYRRYKMGGTTFLTNVITNYWKRFLQLIKVS